MSAILNNVFNFLYEAEIELDDIFLTSLEEGKLKTAVKLGAAGAAAGGAAAYGKRVYDKADPNPISVIKADVSAAAGKASEHANKAISKGKEYLGPTKTTTTEYKPGRFDVGNWKSGETVSKTTTGPSQASVDATAAVNKVKDFAADNVVAVGAAGAAIGAGLIYKYFTSIKHYKNKLASLESKAKSASPDKKSSYQSAINTVKQKLTAAQAKARTEHGSFIEKSRQMKAQVAEMTKAGRKAEAAKLSAKLTKRQAFLSKIGASV